MTNERYYFPDPNGSKKEIIRGVIGSDGSVTAINQWVSSPTCEANKEALTRPQRIGTPDLFDFRYFRTPGTVIKQTGSQRTEDELKDTIIYSTWRKNG